MPTVTCPMCNGKKKLAGQTCAECRGTGKVPDKIERRAKAPRKPS